jgi:hypothetical protein
MWALVLALLPLVDAFSIDIPQAGVVRGRDARLLLRLHNNIRAQTAQGRTKSVNGHLPPATRMNKLVRESTSLVYKQTRRVDVEPKAGCRCRAVGDNVQQIPRYDVVTRYC